MLKINTGRARLLLWIAQNYGTAWFTSEMLYERSFDFAMKQNTVGGTLSFLGSNGYLEKTRGTRTINGHIQKQWRITRLGIDEAKRLAAQCC